MDTKELFLIKISVVRLRSKASKLNNIIRYLIFYISLSLKLKFNLSLLII